MIILLIIGLVLWLIQIPVLLLEHRETKTIVQAFRISSGDEFTIRWMHSVELQPWEEVFRIDEGYGLVLDRTRFKSFGAGVPNDAGNKSEIKDGWVIFSRINKKMAEVTYGISDYGKHVFCYRDFHLKLYEIIPDGDGLNIKTSKLPLFSYIFCN